MNLRQALKQSEFRKAHHQTDRLSVTVEQVTNGFELSYNGKQKHYITYEGLAVFLGSEVVKAEWIPIQTAEE